MLWITTPDPTCRCCSSTRLGQKLIDLRRRDDGRSACSGCARSSASTCDAMDTLLGFFQFTDRWHQAPRMLFVLAAGATAFLFALGVSSARAVDRSRAAPAGRAGGRVDGHKAVGAPCCTRSSRSRVRAAEGEPNAARCRSTLHTPGSARRTRCALLLDQDRRWPLHPAARSCVVVALVAAGSRRRDCCSSP